MSVLKGHMCLPSKNVDSVSIYSGWSWPCLFMGSFWFAAKGMYGWFVLSFFLKISTLGASWLIIPALANSLYENFLRRKGFIDIGS